jgi:hypothetical protein
MKHPPANPAADQPQMLPKRTLGEVLPPVSHGNECRLVTKVNVLGKLGGDLRVLKSIRDGDKIRIEVVK